MDGDGDDGAKGLFSAPTGKEAAHKAMQALWEVWKCRPIETSCSDALYLGSAHVFTASCGTQGSRTGMGRGSVAGFVALPAFSFVPHSGLGMKDYIRL